MTLLVVVKTLAPTPAPEMPLLLIKVVLLKMSPLPLTTTMEGAEIPIATTRSFRFRAVAGRLPAVSTTVPDLVQEARM